MRKLLITLDDDLDEALAKHVNQNEIVRQALRLYVCDISPDTVEGLRASYAIISKTLREVNSKIDYLTK